MSVWFKSRLNPWYIWIPSNPNLYSTKIIMKIRWQTIASNVSIRTISPTATPLPKAYDCVAVYIAGRRTSLVVYGWWPQPPTKNEIRLKKLYSMCHNRIRNQKMRNIRRGMQKQVPMTISYFMPLVTKIFIFLGDDEVIPSIDPAKVCQGFPFTCIH